ncbi:hypothetical protein F503_01783 [Ophiostoma piceae UAMH 11346]|uniref:Uncharacterized protein n=1 Tax=Ophiostoma piceae (strain UAMH 11346) TaxID=1262450 RepID=S3CC70_OPHP1|nr:hypothetical protein F503_01783 [Ophiostoma piceae UAMH 11346]
MPMTSPGAGDLMVVMMMGEEEKGGVYKGEDGIYRNRADAMVGQTVVSERASVRGRMEWSEAELKCVQRRREARKKKQRSEKRGARESASVSYAITRCSTIEGTDPAAAPRAVVCEANQRPWEIAEGRWWQMVADGGRWQIKAFERRFNAG